jgi:hypothetical protein
VSVHGGTRWRHTRTHLIDGAGIRPAMHPGCGVAPPSNIPDILGRRALPAGRLAALGATPPLMRWVLVSVWRTRLFLPLD